MGRLCRKVSRGIKEAAEAGANATKRALREIAKKIRDKQKEIDDLRKAIDDVDNGNFDEKVKKQMKKALQELKEQAEKELGDLREQQRKLRKIQNNSNASYDKLNDIVEVLEDNDEHLKQLSFVEASIEIEKAIDEALVGAEPDEALIGFDENFDFRKVDVEYIAELISDEGLENWARVVGLPAPSEFSGSRRMAARIVYGTVAPGLEDMGFQLSEHPCDPVAATIREFYQEAIDKTAEQSEETLQEERAYQLASPNRLQEYAYFQMAPGNDKVIDPCIDEETAEEEAKLKIKKAYLVGKRDAERNKMLIKGLLAVFGLDFLVEDIDGDDSWDIIIQLLIAGQWLLAAAKFARLIWRIVRTPRLWRRLVQRYGRFGALRFLAGLGGRLVPAVLAGLIAYAWYDIFKEWKKKKAGWDKKLKQLYQDSDVPNKDEIFKANLGYIPN
ncbi:hypothetical protein [Pleionea sp. CnH1-48]|uniref:hypothetical protein n=1 Tax=Pleionea sp. CnH1-48 TaxID=2954494 RepID=UPI002097BE29|nr:hypothetical protein [Pleionea sp. CnH1-48]MCO7224286.1 hypothetical protein [Pleionea sp. CnH1-48]